jgi:hypothetical protein
MAKKAKNIFAHQRKCHEKKITWKSKEKNIPSKIM